jgi:hypothetical protein
MFVELTNPECRWGLVPYGDTEKTNDLFVLRRQNAAQYLAMLGVHHVHDLKDPEVPAIQAEYDRYLDMTKHSPEQRELHSERIVKLAPGVSIAEAIKNSGEQALLSEWSERDGIPLLTPEEQLFGEATTLLKHLPKEEVFFFYAEREVAPWMLAHKAGDPESFQDRMNRVFRIFKSAEALSGMDWTYKHFADAFQHYLGRPLDPSGDNDYSDLVHAYEIPAKRDELVGRVSTAMERYRDGHLAGFELARWHRGKSPFVLYGGDHVRTVQPTIELLGQPVPDTSA